jgi:hypothetical protein
MGVVDRGFKPKTIKLVFVASPLSMLASSVVDRGFKPKTIKLVFVAFPLSMQHKGERAKNQDNVSEWSNMSIHRLLFQSASTIKIQISVLV